MLQITGVMPQLALFFNSFIIVCSFYRGKTNLFQGVTGMSRKNSDSDKVQAVEVKCPKCEFTQIKYIPKEQIGKCPECGSNMIISEILEEGKSY
jgi:ribosomal protein S27E